MSRCNCSDDPRCINCANKKMRINTLGSRQKIKSCVLRNQQVPTAEVDSGQQLLSKKDNGK